jgi:hypothetical protein
MPAMVAIPQVVEELPGQFGCRGEPLHGDTECQDRSSYGPHCRRLPTELTLTKSYPLGALTDRV